MKILDRLPIADRPHLVSVQGDVAEIYRNQIVVWVSIGDLMRPFPALLDTGHSHNFSISRDQLRLWSGEKLEKIGELELGGARVSQYQTELRIHSNVPGRTERSGETYLLEMPQGISVMDDDAPRLPLIGLRTLISNKLRLLVDGERQRVTLKTKRWF